MSVASSPSSPEARPRSPFLLAADLLDPPTDPYAADPVGYAHDVLGFHAWSKQRDIMNSVRDHARTSVRACHGPGKTATGAQIVLWYLGTHRNSRVITTAPTWAQVEELLWREIRGSVGRAHGAGQGAIFPVPQVTKLQLGDQWFAIGLSTNQPERFQGHHADHLLLVVDEASGVDEAIYEAAEGFMTAEGAKVLLLGNPTRLGGQFHRSFTAERDRWNTIHISVYDTPNFTGEKVPPHVARSLPTQAWVDDALKTYGQDSAMFQVRALGNFPSNAQDSVVSLGDAEAAQLRDLPTPYPAQQDDVRVICDVARFGNDETVIGTRHGNRIRVRHTHVGKATTETVGRIIEVWRELRAESGADPIIIVDDDGVGGGVTDQLREKDFEVHPFHGGARAIEHKHYPNARSEAWFRLARRLPELDLDQDEQLLADLTAPRYKLNSDGQRVVERKDDTKKRLGRSPDRGDMAIMALAPSLQVVLPDRGSDLVHRSREEWDAPAPLAGSLTADLLDDPM